MAYISCFDPSLFEADVEPMPDVLWPNAKEILCSAVSRCTRYIALGLDDALACVWDRQSGEQILNISTFTLHRIYSSSSSQLVVRYILDFPERNLTEKR